MFEVGMSVLVLKICSEYAKSLGLNFPPCTQQEINAICQWVDKHAVKDMTISQDGYTVTFTFKGEYDTTKEFTITIPKNVNIDELEKVLVGSESIVVDRLEDNSGLKVSLAQSVVNDINSKITKPANPTADSVITMAANGTVGTKPLSEISGVKLYRHNMYFYVDQDNVYRMTVYTSDKTPYSPETFFTDIKYRYIFNCGTVEVNKLRYIIEYFSFENDTIKIFYINTDGTHLSKDVEVSQLLGNDAVVEV